MLEKGILIVDGKEKNINQMKETYSYLTPIQKYEIQYFNKIGQGKKRILYYSLLLPSSGAK